MLYFFVFLLLVIIIAPALVIIPQSFTSLNYFIYPIKSFSLKWYDKFFMNEQWITSLERSLFIAICVAVFATIIGTLAALAVNKLKFKGKNLFLNLMLTPMIVPVVITGVALYASFAKVGLNNTILREAPRAASSSLRVPSARMPAVRWSAPSTHSLPPTRPTCSAAPSRSSSPLRRRSPRSSPRRKRCSSKMPTTCRVEH